MSRGGYREGSGRKVGALTKKTAEIAMRAAEQGISPIEVHLGEMRFSHEVSESLKKPYLKFINKFCNKAEEGVFDPELMKAIREIAHIRQTAVSTALAAAPFIHPRLAALEVYEPPSDALLQSLMRQHGSREK
jgi:hypothetical protein